MQGVSSPVYHFTSSPQPYPTSDDTTRLDQQLARLRQTINSRTSDKYTSREKFTGSPYSSRDKLSGITSPTIMIPERDSDLIENDTSGTLSDISNYISRLEAVQNRLSDLKLSTHTLYN